VRAALVITLAMLASLMLMPPHAVPQRVSQEAPLPKIAPAPEFALTSQDGVQVKLADFRGKVVAVTLIFTICTVTCPVLTPMMSFVQDRLMMQTAYARAEPALGAQHRDELPPLLIRLPYRHGQAA
jgi:cytochrome oxidase Cu insertion factor (SCO1/SenC/PrrC family)